MKDIDFDELDRAVSSVLGPKPSSDDDGAAAKRADTDTSSESVESQPEKSPEPAVESAAPEPAAAPTPSLATRRRGKFMDVMHPSADMAPASPAPKSARTVAPLTPTAVSETEPVEEPASPAEQSIEPTASLDESGTLIGAEPAPVESMLPEHVESSDVETPKVDEPVTTADLAEEQVEKKDEDATDAVPSDSAESIPSLYVDPLEAASEQSVTETPEATDITPTETLSETEPQDEIPVQPTPFLTDTKVDKRPLGAFGEADAALPADEATPGAQPADVQGAPTVPLPRELQPDVVEVESTQEGDVTQPDAGPAVTSAPGAQSASHDDGRVEGHPLFDTSTYHEPIAAAQGKGTPGWVKWLIGLLVCLALGAGVGYFLFTAGL